MNKKIVIMIICLCGILTACSYKEFFKQYQRVVSGSAIDGGENSGQVKETKKETAATSSSVMGDIVTGSGIHSADNVTMDRQTADYWIDRTNAPDKVLANQKEIQNYNKELKKQMSQDSDTLFFDVDSYDESIAGYRLRKLMGENAFVLKPYTDSQGKNISSEQWQEYLKNCNYDSIADFNTVRYGVVCRRANVRVLPTEDRIFDNADSGYSDVLQSTALAVNEPVLVMHTSSDNGWYFIVAEEYAGWVSCDTIGLAASRKEWQEIRETEHFLVVTGDRIQTKEIPGDELSGNYEFTMGTKLPLAENAAWKDLKSKSGDKNSVYDSYVVKVPKRSEDGSLTYALLAIPLNKEVSIGYMEYTRANILRQAFKMLGNPYGWGGADGERDCSSLVRDVYLCFGFHLPRNSGDMAKLSENVDVKGLSEKETIQKLMGAEPGAILQMPGHVMIYLGCEDKNYFVLSARGGKFQRVMINDLHAQTEDGKNWAAQLETIVNLMSA